MLLTHYSSLGGIQDFFWEKGGGGGGVGGVRVTGKRIDNRDFCVTSLRFTF